jgi:hypothetical protein
MKKLLALKKCQYLKVNDYFNLLNLIDKSYVILIKIEVY